MEGQEGRCKAGSLELPGPFAGPCRIPRGNPRAFKACFLEGEDGEFGKLKGSPYLPSSFWRPGGSRRLAGSEALTIWFIRQMLAVGLSVRYSSGRGRKEGETTSAEVQLTFIQARRGGSRPHDQAEHETDQRGFILKRRFVEAIRETLVRWEVWGML